MTFSPATTIIDAYCQTLQRLLTLAETLSDEQMHWQPAADNHSIAFHLWHVARWADHFQAVVPGMTAELGQRLGPGVQVWEAEELAARWHFDSPQLGYASTGMSMSDDVATHLPFPHKDELLAYMRKAFAAAERASRAIDDHQFVEVEQPQPLTEDIWGGSSVGSAVVVHLTHTNRHLGMIECLRGLQGSSGTATV